MSDNLHGLVVRSKKSGLKYQILTDFCPGQPDFIGLRGLYASARTYRVRLRKLWRRYERVGVSEIPIEGRYSTAGQLRY